MGLRTLKIIRCMTAPSYGCFMFLHPLNRMRPYLPWSPVYSEIGAITSGVYSESDPRWRNLRHPGAQCSCRPLADYRNSLGWLWMIPTPPSVVAWKFSMLSLAADFCTCLGYWKLGRASTTRITHFDYLWLAWGFLLAKYKHKCYIYIYIYWLVVWNIFYFSIWLGNVIIPIDELIFSEG